MKAFDGTSIDKMVTFKQRILIVPPFWQQIVAHSLPTVNEATQNQEPSMLDLEQDDDLLAVSGFIRESIFNLDRSWYDPE